MNPGLMRKIFIYLVGVVIGIVLLQLMPREKGTREEHPWHAQTAPEGAFPLVVTDDYGREVTLAKQPRWLVSLAPSVTEMLFAMGMGDHLIAVTKWDDYPAEAKQLRDAGQNLGELDRPDIESIYRVGADLAIGSKLTPPHVYARIERPPAPMAVALEASSLDDLIEHDFPLLGKILGVPGKALPVVRSLRERRAAVARQLETVQQAPARRAVVLLGLEANLTPGFSPGAGTWVGSLLEEAHGENLAAQLSRSWGQLTLESLVTLDPEVIFIEDGKTEAEQRLLRERLARLPTDPVWQHLRAVRENRLVLVEAGPLSIPGPRMVDLLEAFARGLWPEAMEGPDLGSN